MHALPPFMLAFLPFLQGIAAISGGSWAFLLALLPFFAVLAAISGGNADVSVHDTDHVTSADDTCPPPLQLMLCWAVPMVACPLLAVRLN